ncbi:hypothetical protein [Bradyrhizobium sp. SBR1B]|uniref:hypothetical protein n=1 Tax=Bradyrhizobium sp. SBR1B TaxID=2663836 RepID=UPI0016060596|nr:hypothetical protein [Bradyrhizobium sp. SBR1B]MBB4383163.1 hypothetical protein [Bradyrhizobium sp. SBR1B]
MTVDDADESDVGAVVKRHQLDFLADVADAPRLERQIAELAYLCSAACCSTHECASPRPSEHRQHVCTEAARDDLASLVVTLAPCVGVAAALARDPFGIALHRIPDRDEVDRAYQVLRLGQEVRRANISRFPSG